MKKLLSEVYRDQFFRTQYLLRHHGCVIMAGIHYILIPYIFMRNRLLVFIL